jgi:hypothetical protein
MTCGPFLGNEWANTLPWKVDYWKTTDYETWFPWIQKLKVALELTHGF